MSYYLITWDESDGNDCTVFDTIVQAESRELALGLLSDSIEKTLTNSGTSYESDGNELGYYFNCADDCPEDCEEAHGGINLRTVETYSTEEEAYAARSRWHSEWVIPEPVTQQDSVIDARD